MSILNLPKEELRDVNIEITDPKKVMLEVLKETKDKKNIVVMLFSSYYSYKTVIDLINSTWEKEFSHYLNDNCIELEIVCPKNNFEIEIPKIL